MGIFDVFTYISPIFDSLTGNTRQKRVDCTTAIYMLTDVFLEKELHHSKVHTPQESYIAIKTYLNELSFVLSFINPDDYSYNDIVDIKSNRKIELSNRFSKDNLKEYQSLYSVSKSNDKYKNMLMIITSKVLSVKKWEWMDAHLSGVWNLIIHTEQ